MARFVIFVQIAQELLVILENGIRRWIGIAREIGNQHQVTNGLAVPIRVNGTLQCRMAFVVRNILNTMISKLTQYAALRNGKRFGSLSWKTAVQNTRGLDPRTATRTAAPDIGFTTNRSTATRSTARHV